MKFSQIILTTFVAVLLSSCGDNPSPPAVQDITLDDNSVVEGSTLTVATSYRLSAPKSEGFTSEPFYSIINIPAGATYVPGTSNILFQSGRNPDSIGQCPDGRTWLRYSFASGEFEDSDKFDPMIGVIEFNIVVSLAADDQDVVAVASSEEQADPCTLIDGESITLSVYE